MLVYWWFTVPSWKVKHHLKQKKSMHEVGLRGSKKMGTQPLVTTNPGFFVGFIKLAAIKCIQLVGTTQPLFNHIWPCHPPLKIWLDFFKGNLQTTGKKKDPEIQNIAVSLQDFHFSGWIYEIVPTKICQSPKNLQTELVSHIIHIIQIEQKQTTFLLGYR